MKIKHAILPSIAIIIYLLTYSGMYLVEKKHSEEADTTKIFLQALSLASTPDERARLISLYQSLQTGSTSALENAIITSQQAIDALTPGTEHCVSDDENCAVYTQELAQKGKYKAHDIANHAIKLGTLILGAALPTILIEYAYIVSGRKKPEWTSYLASWRKRKKR